MSRFVFSSDQLPADLDDRSRMSLWREIYRSQCGLDADIGHVPGTPFQARLELLQFGTAALARIDGATDRYVRTSRTIATRPDDIRLGFVLGNSSAVLSQRGREALVVPGAMTVWSNTEPVEARHKGRHGWGVVVMPRRRLTELVKGADDLAGTVLDRDQPAVCHLRRYFDFALSSQEIDDPTLAVPIDTMILDLVALALGARGEAAEFASMRGLRAARARAIVAAIRAGFARPGFSPRDVAGKLGISPRYLQVLLQETGTGFTARVNELRLQKARAMLTDRRFDHLRIAEIAFACGFGEASYFNQCFRQRFGHAPRDVRGERHRD